MKKEWQITLKFRTNGDLIDLKILVLKINTIAVIKRIHGNHVHCFAKFPDFFLTIVLFPWPTVVTVLYINPYET